MKIIGGEGGGDEGGILKFYLTPQNIKNIIFLIYLYPSLTSSHTNVYTNNLMDTILIMHRRPRHIHHGK